LICCLWNAFKGNVKILLESTVNNILKTENCFNVTANGGCFSCTSLVVATGGPSIPKIGGSGFGYEIAEKFGLKIIPPRAALVPLILNNNVLDYFKALSGISLNVIAKYEKVKFEEGMLFTHRGLSGPVILQISSYWREGNTININLVPKFDIFQELVSRKLTTPKQDISTALTDILPKRLIQTICSFININGQLANIPNAILKEFAEFLNNWRLIPSGTEGYKTAEVTLGGVDTNELSSNSFESKKVPGLYFIGEVIDVTGHLGGYNFQWAWSSGYVAGQFV
jgi:predicted Rossmann fold flavoprotein